MDRILIDNPEDGQVIVIDNHETGTRGRMLVYNYDEAAQVLRMPPDVIHALIEALEKLRCMQGTRPTRVTIPDTAMRHKGWTYWVIREDRSQGTQPPIQYYFPRVCWGTDLETVFTLHAEPSHAAAIKAALTYINELRPLDDNPASWGGLQESLHETPAETDPERG